jgi:hypothetical protein
MKKIFFFAFVILTAGYMLAAEGKAVSYKSGDEMVRRDSLHTLGQWSVSRDRRHPRMVGTERLDKRAGCETFRPGI